MGSWVRTVQSGLDWTSGHSLIVGLPRGSTLLRIHFGWGFYGDSQTAADLESIAANLQVMGLVTTVGTGSESVPNARTQSADQAPPTQRWTYWEGRAPKIATYDGTANLVTWQDSGAQEQVDTKGQVSAKTIAVGDSLNVWASWAAGGAWDSSGSVNLWYYASLLYQ